MRFFVEPYLDTHDWTVGLSFFRYRVHDIEMAFDLTVHILALKVVIRF